MYPVAGEKTKLQIHLETFSRVIPRNGKDRIEMKTRYRSSKCLHFPCTREAIPQWVCRREQVDPGPGMYEEGAGNMGPCIWSENPEVGEQIGTGDRVGARWRFVG